MKRPKLVLSKPQAIAAVRRGDSLRDVACRADVSHVTVSRWVKAAIATPEPPPLASPAIDVPDTPEPEPEELPPDLTGDMSTLEKTKAMQAYQYLIAKQAQRDGNTSAAQRALRDAAALANTIARLESAERATGDDMVISQAEVSDIKDQLNARFAALLARPLLCAKCNRALSVTYGGKGESDR